MYFKIIKKHVGFYICKGANEQWKHQGFHLRLDICSTRGIVEQPAVASCQPLRKNTG